MFTEISYRPEEIIALLQPQRTAGRTTAGIRDVASLSSAGAGDLSFLGNAKYRSQVAETKASIVLLPEDYVGEPVADQLFLFVKNPSVSLAALCTRIEQQLWPKPVAGIHATAQIATGARVDPAATIGPFCVVEDGANVGAGAHLQASVFVGRHATIGPDCWLMPGVVLGAYCSLGRRVRLQPGVVVGADGFGYTFVNGRHEKVPQIGTVEINDDVEIGANTTLDRARFSRTVVGEGTKIDNLVQIGHNVVIGKHCILCAQVGLSGSTILEDYVVLGGQAGLGGHLTVGKGAKVGGQAGITGDVPAGAYLNGTPAIPYMLERRIAILQQRLPDLFKRVEILELAKEKTSAAG